MPRSPHTDDRHSIIICNSWAQISCIIARRHVLHTYSCYATEIESQPPLYCLAAGAASFESTSERTKRKRAFSESCRVWYIACVLLLYSVKRSHISILLLWQESQAWSSHLPSLLTWWRIRWSTNGFSKQSMTLAFHYSNHQWVRCNAIWIAGYHWSTCTPAMNCWFLLLMWPGYGIAIVLLQRSMRHLSLEDLVHFWMLLLPSHCNMEMQRMSPKIAY